MKETRGDNLRGTGLSVLGHGALIALVLLGLHRLQHDSSAGGGEGSLQADLAKFEDLPPGVQHALRQAPVPPAPQPLPEPLPPPVTDALPTPVPPPPAPVPPPAPAPAPVPVPKPVPVPAPKPVAKAPAPVPPPSKPVAKPPAPAAKPATKPPQTAAAAPATAGADAAKAKRAADLARQRAEQMADARAAAGTPDASAGKAQGAGHGRSHDGQQKWLDAVARAIESEWIRPDDVPKGQRCPIRIRIIQGGEVISAVVQPGCPYSGAARRSVEDAVMKASPLPFKGFEDVYSREFTVNFYPSR